MTAITLDQSELAEARIAAAKLWNYWDSSEPKKSEAIRILSDFYAEYAVVKYFNEVLGAAPKVHFDIAYKNCGDGGFDFVCADTKFEVRTDDSQAIKNDRSRVTKADAIVGVVRTAKTGEFHRYEIFGFMPVSRLALKGRLLARDDFLDLITLARARSDVFRGERPRTTERHGPQRVGDIISGMFLMKSLRD